MGPASGIVSGALALAERNVPRYTSYPSAPHFTAAVTADVYRAWLDTLPEGARISLYIHVPFCTELCHYCGCNTRAVRRRGPVDAYAEKLIAEIRMLESLNGARLTHLHWGGGTPSILGPRWFETIAAQLAAQFDLGDIRERAIELDPRDPEPHYTLALCTILLAEPQRAEAALRHCLGLSPSYAPAYGLLGLARTMLGHPEEAAALCSRAFALSPHEPLRAIWHWTEAWASLEMDDDAAALLHAQRGMTANPDFPSCHLAAAVAAHRLGDAALAARCVRFLRDGTAFASIEAITRNLPVVQRARRGARVLADLRAAGIPESQVDRGNASR